MIIPKGETVLSLKVVFYISKTTKLFGTITLKFVCKINPRLPHLHPPVVYTPHVPAAAKTAVQQLAGQFVHAARYRSLPASRFDTSLVDERQSPAKTEVVDFSYKPLPENNAAPVPTGEVGAISGTSGKLGTISGLPAVTVLSTDTFGFADAQDTAVKETLFRHQVIFFLSYS